MNVVEIVCFEILEVFWVIEISSAFAGQMLSQSIIAAAFDQVRKKSILSPAVENVTISPICSFLDLVSGKSRSE